jgi:hypothetical protein
MDTALSKDEVVPSLWRAYKKSREFKSGAIEAIPINHTCVVQQEIVGLKRIYHDFIEEPLRYSNTRIGLENRTLGSWIDEWKKMHTTLFKTAL